MSNDFEVHSIGVARELKLSRELADTIQQMTEQFGEGIVPYSVLEAYQRLRAHHAWQVETETI